MAKVLHAADFHLDSAFRSLPEEQARLRRQESRELARPPGGLGQRPRSPADAAGR
ncbi:MAG: hypothetical protein ACLR5H_14450 [Oscillospiraceae bacterium]